MAVLAVPENKILKRLRTEGATFQPNFRGHIAELDALRAIGLCLVLIDHFWPPALSYVLFQLGNLGWIAMDSFFVMSGVLITGILLDSRDKPKYYSNYYARRGLRIFPLYYSVLLLWWLIAHYTYDGEGYRTLIREWGSPAWFTFYLGNIRVAILNKWPTIPGYDPLWSLQVEEQFYLLFPLLVAFLRRDHLRRLLIAALILSPALRIACYFLQPNNPYMPYVLLPTHCDGLALGGLLAIRLRSGPWNISKPALTAWTVLLLGAACAGSLLSTWGTQSQASVTAWDRLPGYSISSAACACLVLWLICYRGSNYTRWMRVAPLQYLGRISYGVYLLHPVASWTAYMLLKRKLIHIGKDGALFFALEVALSLIYAAISWHFFEGPILELKKRFSYSTAKTAIADAAG